MTYLHEHLHHGIPTRGRLHHDIHTWTFTSWHTHKWTFASWREPRKRLHHDMPIRRHLHHKTFCISISARRHLHYDWICALAPSWINFASAPLHGTSASWKLHLWKETCASYGHFASASLWKAFASKIKNLDLYHILFTFIRKLTSRSAVKSLSITY